jgi:PPOX class probable FMN-dependent enzyme
MPDHIIRNEAALRALYGAPSEGSLLKQTASLHPHYQAMIRLAPFAVLATVGASGVDVSPRGDDPGFVEIQDDHTLLLPDRRGNNRIDSLRNIVADPRVALLFLIPGVGETLRVNGTAAISTDPALLERFVFAGKPPRTVLVVDVTAVFFQCTKALVRSKLWKPEAQVARNAFASTGTILADISTNRVGGADYDRAAPGRVAETLY